MCIERMRLLLDEVRVGDLVTGDPEHGNKMYTYTNEDMLVGEVIAVGDGLLGDGLFTVRIIDHVNKTYIGDTWGDLNPKYFNYAKGYMPFDQSNDDCSAESIRSLWGDGDS